MTSDGRYFLKHGKHPKEVRAEKERLAGDAEQAERAPADGAELIARLQSATAGKLTVPDPGPQTRGRWRAAFYDALHHDHVPGELKLRRTGRQRGDCVFTLVDEEAEKAAQPPPVPTIDVPDVLGRPHQLVRATRKALGRSKTVVDTRGTPEKPATAPFAVPAQPPDPGAADPAAPGPEQLSRCPGGTDFRRRAGRRPSRLDGCGDQPFRTAPEPAM
ncbi:hypothetical protein QA802_31865 [Streptomyces sp. B21-105]|uniref:hypothetical protein n=1 Tax=Streptomyces sp. B21-105 TaxID=3039417 RepID=UPI002FF1B703